MLEQKIIYKLIYKLDFIDLNILEQIILSDYNLAFPLLVKRLEKINVWNRGIIKRRVDKLKKLKILFFDEHTSPMVIEVYQHKENETKVLKELLRSRLVRY